MKTTRAYTMDQDVVRILRNKPNKSAYVNLAVRKMHSQEMYFDISNVSTRQLMACLQQRDDCARHIRIVLWDQLQAES